MNRRQFIATSATVLAATALANQPEPAKPTPTPTPTKRTLRKAVMIGMVGEGKTLQDKFQILRDAGFDGVECDSPSDTPADEVLSAMDKTGLKVHGLVDSVHWRFHLNDPDQGARDKAVQALSTALADGAKYGCTSVLLVPAVVNDKLPYDEAWDLSMEGIHQCLHIAKETGVKIAIENVWNNFIMSPMEAVRYVDELNTQPSINPAGRASGIGLPVGWHFDIGNVIHYGYPDQWVRILGGRILKLHIKDFSRKKANEEGTGKGFDVELGDGDAGWPSLMKALDEVGYSTAPSGNWATAEVRGGDAKRLKVISEQMDRLFAM